MQKREVAKYVPRHVDATVCSLINTTGIGVSEPRGLSIGGSEKTPLPPPQNAAQNGTRQQRKTHLPHVVDGNQNLDASLPDEAPPGEARSETMMGVTTKDVTTKVEKARVRSQSPHREVFPTHVNPAGQAWRTS